MRKSLASVIAPFMLMPVLAFSSGKKEAISGEPENKSESEGVTLRGYAYDECYMPASIGGPTPAGTIESIYSFSIRIYKGAVSEYKSFKVIPISDISLESVNALIKDGTPVEIQVKRDEADKQFITVYADKIKVPDRY